MRSGEKFELISRGSNGKRFMQIMNYLPSAFYDGVFGQLQREHIDPARKLAGVLGIAATLHYNERRELILYVSVNATAKIGSFALPNTPLSDDGLRPKYDRIRKIFLKESSSAASKSDPVPFNDALKKISLALRFSFNCELWAFCAPVSPRSVAFCRLFFELLGRSQMFKTIRTSNYGKECEEFVRKQMRSAHLEKLCVSPASWPVDFKELVSSFIGNPKFSSLWSMSSDAMLDYESVSSLLQRCSSGDIQKVLVHTKISFGKEQLLELLHNSALRLEGSTFRLAQRPELKIKFDGNVLDIDSR
ncbi:hypothetical protein QR680_016369 [Steinernema hermaphroditum]|uniref:Uncharacterized protein n=1 Tax=Steinernema hermaphroditum TaxID=289476 RepID=A0AA39LMG7_9BILA|nr:hypothetical protein QR680_016369 [Steinernema hermaphroditum]